MNEGQERIGLAYRVEKMRIQDIPQVVDIERQSFPSPWPARAYRYEVTQNRLAHYYVATSQIPPEAQKQTGEEPGLLGRLQTWTRRDDEDHRHVVGYCGFWVVAQEAHISTIAVEPRYRRQGIAQLLLVTVIEKAMEMDATLVSLEVRVSNLAAQNLYRKYGFKKVGRRPRYYSDNREDALIMTADHITSTAYQRFFRQQRDRLHKRLERIASRVREDRGQGSQPSSDG
jgi:ribosomal-protein-alanine N-acetyltransferase